MEYFQIKDVFVIADTSGRFDQILANINTLFKVSRILPGTRVFQVASNSLTWLLLEGAHTIQVPEGIRQSKEWCALIPLLGSSIVTTTGLKWNLSKFFCDVLISSKCFF